MEQFELSLNWLDAEVIYDDARRQDYYEALERDNARLVNERDRAYDQCGWARFVLLLSVIGNVAQFVWAAVRG